MFGLHLIAAYLRATLGGKYPRDGGTGTGYRGENPNPDWRDPGTPEGWYKETGERNYAEPGSGAKMGPGVPYPERPKGKPISDFRERGGTLGSTKEFAPIGGLKQGSPVMGRKILR